MRAPARPSANGVLGYPALFAYGLFGMPLAMAALPLYVHLPKFYGDHLGVPLAALGVLLLVLRLADGVLDPLLGAWSDRARSRKRLIALAVPLLAVGMAALFAPQVDGNAALLVWLGVALAAVYLAFSLATINHNAWGAELVGRSRRAHADHRGAGRPGAGGRRGREHRARADGRRRRRGGRTAAVRGRLRVVPAAVRRDHAGRGPRRRAQRRSAPVQVRGHGGAAGRPDVPPAARGVHGQRHRLGHSGDARALLHRRCPAGRGAAGIVPRAVLHRRRRGDAAVGEAFGADRQGARVGRGDGRGDRRVHVGGVPGRRRCHRVRRHLRAVRPGARRRPGAAAVAAGRRHRPRRTHARDRHLFRPVDAGDQTQPGPGRGHRPAAAGLARLRTRCARSRCRARARARLCGSTLRAETRRCRRALPLCPKLQESR